MDDPLAATIVAPDTLPRVGATFAGRYRIVAPLGAGGMGAVFKAHDEELDEDIALKVLSHALADNPEALGRFRREVKLARRVTHVNVARTYNLGVHQGAPFLTMELIDGVPLSARRAGGALSLSETLRIGSEIARGLAAAHAADVVHRDLKPENVMVSDDRVVITDFGIARSARMDGDARMTSGLIGTPAYMAPEQVAGQPLDGRTDVYALGVLLFEALCGKLPFEAPTPLALAASRLTTEPPDPRTLVPRLPAAIAELVLHMLSRAREARPAAQTVLARLETLRGEAAPVLPGVPAQPSRARAARVRIGDIEASEPREIELATELARALTECVHTSERAELVQGDADLLLGASVRVRRERARVRLRLQRSGVDAWITSVDGTLADEFELEDAVVAAVSGALRQHAPELVTVGTRLTPPRSTLDRLDPAVRELADEAMVKLDLAALDVTQLQGAMQLLEQAAAQAPDDASLQGALAFALARRRMMTFSATAREEWVRAEELCYRAIASDAGNPLALQALGMLRYVDGEMRGAARALREALTRSPDLVEANAYLARLLEESGYAELARERIAVLERLAPNRPEPFVVRMREAGFNGDLAEIDREAAESIRRTGSRAFSLLLRTRIALWWNDRERVRRCLADVQTLDWEFARNAMEPLLRLQVSDDTADVATIEGLFAHDLVEGAGRRRMSYGHQMIAESLLSQGHVAAALAHVEASAALPLIDVAWLDRCPLLAPLRGEPRFAKARAIVTARVEDMWS